MTNDPVDLVYAWCDDTDAKWRAKRMAEAERHGVAASTTENGACRYRGGDMLRHSLRSAAACAPWLRSIFIIVDDDQSLPDWPELKDAKVRVVYHSEMIPARFLPTFCSDTIEHHVARISDLSERFLYANDDMLFWDEVSPSFFFASDGYPYLRFGARRKPTADLDEKPYRQWLDNADRLIVHEFGTSCSSWHSPVGRLPHHNVDAYLKSDLLACYDRFHSEIEAAFANPFRNPMTVQRVVYSDYAYAVGHGHFRRATFNTNCRSAWWRRLLPAWADSLQIVSGRWREAPELFARFHPRLVCFNDGLDTTDEDFAWLRDYLRSRWPEGGCLK